MSPSHNYTTCRLRKPESLSIYRLWGSRHINSLQAGRYVRSNPGGVDIFPASPEGHEAHPISSAVATESFPRVKRPRPYFNPYPANVENMVSF
jgi:hypothetical protein